MWDSRFKNVQKCFQKGAPVMQMHWGWTGTKNLVILINTVFHMKGISASCCVASSWNKDWCSDVWETDLHWSAWCIWWKQMSEKKDALVKINVISKDGHDGNKVAYVFEEKRVQKSSRCNGALWRIKAALPFPHSLALLRFSASVIYDLCQFDQKSAYSSDINCVFSLKIQGEQCAEWLQIVTGCFSSRGWWRHFTEISEFLWPFLLITVN